MATYLTHRLLAVLLLLLGLNGVALPGKGQTVHAILVADTTDPLLHTVCKRDIDIMHRQFVQVAAAIRYELREQVVAGETFSSKRLRNVVSKLSPAPDDIIFLYYTGHGYNARRRAGRFPVMLLDKDAAVSGRNPGLLAVHQVLTAKHARLCITLGDCCNQLVRNMRGMVNKTVAPKALLLTNDSLDEVYRTLFLNVKGDALIASSQPPQQAYAHPDSGSFYTRSFNEALELASRNNKQVSWETLLRDTQSRLTRHQATRTRQSIYVVHVAGRTPARATISFDLINRLLNELTNPTRPATQRQVILNRLTGFFVKQARIDVYVNSTLSQVQRIEPFLQRLYGQHDHSQQLNLIERLSEMTADGRQYSRAAIEAVGVEAGVRYVANEPKAALTPKAVPVPTALSLLVRTDKGRANVTYWAGNQLIVEANVSRPCHIRLVYVLADSITVLLENDAEIKPGQENQYVRIAPDSAFVCAAPFGTEYLLAYAAESAFCPIPTIPNPKLYVRPENGYTVFVGSMPEIRKAVACTTDGGEVVEDRIQIVTRGR
ncbi:caspase family protein [Fibrella sp. HMF5335]|uniref:Caspase family protein n=1 Tax=Fibrella rubiginis TaxID=2817060 RepID=A0A939GA49_9BACT|nr:caspase family protein [Fibrella rubiginis]MBO0935277.1 caspase family protein [Fibrella rubiginis]